MITPFIGDIMYALNEATKSGKTCCKTNIYLLAKPCDIFNFEGLW